MIDLFSNLAGGGVLFVVALLLMAAELFFPSHGLLSILAAGFAVAGVVVTYMASPALGVTSAIVVLMVAPIVVYWAVRLYPKSLVGRRVILAPPKKPDPGAAPHGYEAVAESLAVLMGKRGTALSTLRPAGLCDIEGQRIDCVSESTIVPVGALIEVVGVVGMRVIVREISENKLSDQS